MARLRFPDSASIDRVQATAGSALLSASGATARVYLDEAGTQLADILNADGSANATATLILDNESRLPEWDGPDAGQDQLWVRIDGGAPLLVEATLAQRFAAQNIAVDAQLAAQNALVIDQLVDQNAAVDAELVEHTALQDAKLSVVAPEFAVELYGAVDTTGVTDSSAAILAALAACYAAGGGTVLLPTGIIRCDQTITIPNDGTDVPQQPPIALRGAGASWDGPSRLGGYSPGTTTLDLRSTADPAKLITLGRGMLVLRDITFRNTSNPADVTPFLLTTLTTINVKRCAFYGHQSLGQTTCVQDGIVLGGDSPVKLEDGSTASCFRGYGTVIADCYFSRLARCVYGRAQCNGVVIENNHIGAQCGSSDPAKAAITIDTVEAPTLTIAGITIAKNVLQLNGYTYGIILAGNVSRCTLLANNPWDVLEGWSGAAIYLKGTDAAYNTIIGPRIGIPATGQHVKDDGNVGTIVISEGEVRARLASTPLLLQPGDASPADTTTMLALKRSEEEATNASATLLAILNNASAILGGAWSTAAKLSITNGVRTTVYRETGPNASGAGNNLELKAGSANDGVTVATGGWLRVPVLTTSARNALTGVLVGSVCYDNNLKRLVAHDGTGWYDMAGTAV